MVALSASPHRLTSHAGNLFSEEYAYGLKQLGSKGRRFLVPSVLRALTIVRRQNSTPRAPAMRTCSGMLSRTPATSTKSACSWRGRATAPRCVACFRWRGRVTEWCGATEGPCHDGHPEHFARPEGKGVSAAKRFAPSSSQSTTCSCVRLGEGQQGQADAPRAQGAGANQRRRLAPRHAAVYQRRRWPLAAGRAVPR